MDEEIVHKDSSEEMYKDPNADLSFVVDYGADTDDDQKNEVHKTVHTTEEGEEIEEGQVCAVKVCPDCLKDPSGTCPDCDVHVPPMRPISYY